MGAQRDAGEFPPWNPACVGLYAFGRLWITRPPPMKASWKTSFLAGVAFAGSADLCEVLKIDSGFALGLFILFVPLWVIGFSQIEEIYAEQRRRHSWGLWKDGDIKKHYFPIFGRMLLFALAIAGEIALRKAWGW